MGVNTDLLPAGWSTVAQSGLVPTSFTNAQGVTQQGFAASFAPPDIVITPPPAPPAASATPTIPRTATPITDTPSTASTATADNPPARLTTYNVNANDMRIRLSPLITEAAFTEVLGTRRSGNLLNPLYATSGLLFPYAPQITVSQDVAYQDISPVHSNMDYLAYQRTPAVSISLSGKFTVQNQTEGVYALACLHFLRTVSKMYFGETPAAKRGTPPPILVLNGYGTYMFNNLRVILKSHTYTYPETMDTVLVHAAGGTARLPALFDLALTLVVQQTPKAMRTVFDLDMFRSGALLRQGGWI